MSGSESVSDENVSEENTPNSSTRVTEDESGFGSESGSSIVGESSDGSCDSSDGESSDGESSGEREASSTESEDGESMDEEEGDEEDEEKKLAGKREDFEKMKEISAHMDNIVKRLVNFFPLDVRDKNAAAAPTPPIPVPALSPLPKPQQLKEVSRDIAVSARAMTMDRAVSARRLTTDRAVSVASGSHLYEDLSDTEETSSSQDAKYIESRKRGKSAKGRPGGASSAWGQSRGGSKKGMGARSHKNGPNTAQGNNRARTASLWEDDRKAKNNVTKGQGLRRESSQNPKASHVRTSKPDCSQELQGSSNERLLWDELRKSLKGVAGRERAPPITMNHVGTFEKEEEKRADEERRRRLIDEAIAVLLEDSSCEEEEKGRNVF